MEAVILGTSGSSIMIDKKFAIIAMVFCAAALIMAPFVNAAPWVGTVNPQLHNDLRTLVDWGYLDLSATTYPVPWTGIKRQLDQLDSANLPPTAAVAARRLKHYALVHQKQPSQRFVSFHGATDNTRFKGFDGQYHNKLKVNVSQLARGERWAARVSLNYDSNGKAHFDDSFIMYQFQNWNLRLGAIDQWWGPAQSSSLILSSNARPIATIALSRNQATASKSAWLWFLGPWYFTANLGQLESSRTISNAKTWMTRFTAKPIKGLEIGASWSAMWGGDGLGNSFNDFWDVLTFKPQCANGASSCDKSLYTKKGNHLAGFDLNYTFNLWRRPVSIYIQRVGEDAADYINITDQANLFGLSSYIWGAKVFVEASNTNVACSGDKTTGKNCYYEHGDYRTGYRFYQRAIGSTYDSDAKMITIGFNKHFTNGDVLELSLRSIKLNEDQIKPSPVVKGSTESLLQLDGFYQTQLGNSLLKFGAQLDSSKSEMQTSSIGAVIYTRFDYRF